MALSEREKAKIIEEEELRAEYRKKAHKDAIDERDRDLYGGGALAAIILFVALIMMVKINN